jgi:hypothetical protein
MAASPRVYLSQEFLTFGDGDASLEDARGAAVRPKISREKKYKQSIIILWKLGK